ncbi:MAG TPA: hypothetical protein VKQ54_00340 [Caulobacteraceae bacterium]|nr:hypothetical protein [Caulobacteraceae bacterium]
MPVLQNRRHEAFAQARARGALLIDAYESAGFVRHRGHPSRLALKHDVAERIAELRVSQTDLEDTSPHGLLASLRRIIKAGENSRIPALLNAARLAIVDASRLQAELARQQAAEWRKIDKDFHDFASQNAAVAAPQREAERASPPPEAPAAAASAPRGLPENAPRAPMNLLASAAASPLALPQALVGRRQGVDFSASLDDRRAPVTSARSPSPHVPLPGHRSRRPAEAAP